MTRMPSETTPVPLVSVVIPAYNNERTLAASIESVLQQEDVDFELIVSDHASSDRTLEIARSYAQHPRVAVVTAPAGGGATANWNHVTACARGSLIKLVCGDDTLRPGVLARQAAHFHDRHVALVACRRDVVDLHGRVRLRSRGLQGLAPRMSGSAAVRAAVRSGTNPFGEPACVMTRRDVLRDAGGWWGERPYVIDLATYFLVLERGDFVADPVTGAAFTVSAEQQSATMTRTASREVGWLSRWAAQRHPDVISRTDLRVGAVRRTALSTARAAAFALVRLASRGGPR